jgi:transcriptional regulator with XRE-family HTH domain
MTGYSVKFTEAVAKANQELVGVMLARLCIKKDISVIEVANHFGVSRTAIYAWFLGRSTPNKVHEVKIYKYLKKKA